MSGKTISFIVAIIGLVLIIAGAAYYVMDGCQCSFGVIGAGVLLLIVGLVLFMRPEPEVEAELAPVRQKFACPNCNAFVSPGADVCPKCKKPFESESFECPECNGVVSIYSEVCPLCGATFEEKEYGLCPSCGAKIEVDARECPKCKDEIWSAVKPPFKVLVCPSCHKKVKLEDEACPNCGAKLG